MLVPQPTNDSDESTLPHPELNPLLNPLLAEHMGRWAEVYFTNPPEKRDQAIAELLRELENIPAPEVPPIQLGNSIGDSNELSPDERGLDQAEAEETRDSSRDAGEPVLTCGSCGEKNWRGQRFCGMCGAPLQFEPD